MVNSRVSRLGNSLDIVCAVSAHARNVRGCLAALEGQLRDRQSDGIDLVVAHAGAVSTTLARKFPRVRWIECEPNATLPDLWGRGIATTAGEVVAILDADCPVADGWLNVALTLSARDDPLVGGAVEPRGLKTWAAWGAYFCDYGAFLMPLKAGAAREIAGNNMILRRTLFARAPEFVSPRFWKAHFMRALSARGIVGTSAPQLVINYDRNYAGREWLARRFRHARCFAAMRAADRSWQARMLFGLLAPLVAILLFVRVARNVLPKRRFWRKFSVAVPWIFAGTTAWALGEWVGDWFGAGNTCKEIM